MKLGAHAKLGVASALTSFTLAINSEVPQNMLLWYASVIPTLTHSLPHVSLSAHL